MTSKNVNTSSATVTVVNGKRGPSGCGIVFLGLIGFTAALWPFFLLHGAAAGIVGVLWLTLLGTGAVLGVRARRRSAAAQQAAAVEAGKRERGSEALDALRLSYAEGKITHDQFLERKVALEDSI
jgi:uncharacterized membrane protein